VNERIAAGEGVSGGRLYAVMRERVHRAPKRSTTVSNPASDRRNTDAQPDGISAF